MAEEELTIESLKLDVRKSFAKVYSALKARELQTIRQIDAIWRQCGSGNLVALKRNCLQNIDISYENESSLFNEIHNFGIIDFKKLNIDTNIFIMEDYISPQDDHMYSYKCLEDQIHTDDSDSSLEAAIEEDAFKQITQTDQCVCYVNIAANDIPSKFRTYQPSPGSIEKSESSTSTSSHSTPGATENSLKEDRTRETYVNEEILVVAKDLDTPRLVCQVLQKLNPTQEWLNHIITETETEPSQLTDFMEHRTIECS